MIKILLLAVVPFMTEHRNVVPKTEVSTNFYGSVTGIVDNAYIQAHGGGGGGGGGVDTNAVIDIANATIATNPIVAAKLDGPTVAPMNIAENAGKAADAKATGEEFGDHDIRIREISGALAYVTADLSIKADKVSGATEGNFAAFDGYGNLVDSRRSPLDIQGYVKFDVLQSLTEEQKIMARINIDAISGFDVLVFEQDPLFNSWKDDPSAYFQGECSHALYANALYLYGDEVQILQYDEDSGRWIHLDNGSYRPFAYTSDLPQDYANVSNAAVNARSKLDMNAYERKFDFSELAGIVRCPEESFTAEVAYTEDWSASYWVIRLDESVPYSFHEWETIERYPVGPYVSDADFATIEDRARDPLRNKVVMRNKVGEVYGRLAIESANALRSMLVDANTNQTADCECISTNICKLIAPELNRTVNANLNTYIDRATGVEYKGDWYDGSMYYVPTGNVYPPNEN